MVQITTTTWTVDKFVTQCRTLLQDKGSPYRYPDADLVLNLNNGITEMLKLRPDLFLGITPLPQFDGTSNTTDVVPIDPMYRMPLVYYMVGMAQLRDDEEVQDQRAAAFMAMFNAKLGTVA